MGTNESTHLSEKTSCLYAGLTDLNISYTKSPRGPLKVCLHRGTRDNTEGYEYRIYQFHIP